MSQEQFYQTVQMEQEYRMKTWLEQFIEENADQLVCTYCHEIKGDALGCCDDKSWAFFRDLTLKEQMDVAHKEWNVHHG